MNPKKCKDCGKVFQPFKTMQPRCFDCAVLKGKQDAHKRIKKERKKQAMEFRAETRRRKQAIKTRSDWLRDAQKSFNAFIRERDKQNNEPCISCQRHHDGQYHAGHYLSVGAMPELRFNELNCHLQCAPCNNHLSGNQVLYRVNLINKIGLDKVEWLEGPHDLQKLTIDEIKAIKKTYDQKLKNLKNGG